MHYAIAFDLAPKTMKERDGLSDADVTRVYQEEIPNALAAAGFTVKVQRTLYRTADGADATTCLMKLKPAIEEGAPNLIKYATDIHIFQMDSWSDIHALLDPNGDY